MTKQNIVNIVSEATGLTKVETEAVMNGVMSTIIESLGRNERVELRGFGTFGVKHRMPKKARNPGTGEAIFSLSAMSLFLNLRSICVHMLIINFQNNEVKCPAVKNEKSVK